MTEDTILFLWQKVAVQKKVICKRSVGNVIDKKEAKLYSQCYYPVIDKEKKDLHSIELACFRYSCYGYYTFLKVSESMIFARSVFAEDNKITVNYSQGENRKINSI